MGNAYLATPGTGNAMGRDEDSNGGRQGKVTRLIDDHGLAETGDELERRWTATGEDRASLRDLATLFNRRLVEHYLTEAGVHTLSGEAANLHRLLTDEDVSAADRTRVRRRLERDGVDVDALDAAFVSYQAVRTYLRDHRGVEYESDANPAATAETAVGRLRSRLGTVTESKLAAARNADAVTLGGFDVTVTVRVACRDCGHQVDVGTLLDEGGCDCR